jgi:hypothetical protein
MNQEKQERIKACLQELSTLLYEEADKILLTDLKGIEKTVRSQVLELVSPEIALFITPPIVGSGVTLIVLNFL